MSSYYSRPQIMQCPSCGATLALPDSDSFLCDYCGTRVMVPRELRSKTTQENALPVGRAADQTMPAWLEASLPDAEALAIQRKRVRMILVFSVAIAILLLGIIAFIVAMLTPTSESSYPSQFSSTPLSTTPLPTLVQFSRLALVFGSKGDQPGQFDDGRSIAVDNRGNIFVADYTTGRINKFDAQGKFLQLIQVEPSRADSDVYIYAMAADDQGYLYIAADGQIIKYDTASGTLLLTIPDQWPEIYYETVIVAPDGNLYSTNGMAGADDVMILSPQGDLIAHWTETIENVNHDDPTIELVLGVSHAGMVYILSPFGNKVYGYNPDGTFNFSFGQEGDGAGQFSLSTGMLAITAQDYLVISDVYRVDLFDAKGTYLNKSFTIDYNIAGGSMFGMTMDASGDLYYISSGGKVLKFDMNYP